MRILRLTNSNDFNEDIPEHLRGAAVSEELVSAAIGEPVETVSRAFWPGPKLPGIVSDWLDRYRPDLVIIRCAAYWVSFESVPLRIERKLGWLGRWPARLGKRIGSEPAVAENAVAVRTRRIIVRAIGGDTYFTPAAATEHVESVLRVILAKESVVPVVRGPGHVHNTAGSSRGHRRADARNRDFDGRLAALCGKLRVAYVSARAVGSADALSSDDVHSTSVGMRAFAELESAAIATAWNANSRLDR